MGMLVAEVAAVRPVALIAMANQRSSMYQLHADAWALRV